MLAVTIRPVEGLEAFSDVESLQRAAWNLPDIDILPALQLHALSDNGALTLGAFIDVGTTDEQMVGFVFGVIGTIQEDIDERIDEVAAARLKLYSVMMGIHPDYQSQGIGYQLKLAQRDAAMRLGLRLVTWTFDPLETRNAQLNIGKLGGVCRHYVANYHGFTGGINEGLPTDRFKLEWWITNNRAKNRIDKQRSALSLDAMLAGGAEIINEVGFNEKGYSVPPTAFGPITPLMFLVEVPTNFQALKQVDTGLALAWRQHTARLFTLAFQRGYMVTDFIYHRGEQGLNRAFYLLTNQSG